jgi:transcriptional regulator with XRE-family HTH domain
LIETIDVPRETSERKAAMDEHYAVRTDHLLYRLIAAELRAKRTDRGIGQGQLAERAVMTKRTVIRIEKDQTRVSMLDFVKICAAMGIQPGVMLDEIVTMLNTSNVPDSQKILIAALPSLRP